MNFFNFIDQLNFKQRRNLVVFFETKPYSLSVMEIEVKGNTKLGRKLLKELNMNLK